jgi:hypothetical protein
MNKRKFKVEKYLESEEYKILLNFINKSYEKNPNNFKQEVKNGIQGILTNFFTEPEALQLSNLLQDEKTLNQFILNMTSLTEFKEDSKYFSFSNTLINKLFSTDLPDIKTKYFKLPFNYMCIDCRIELEENITANNILLVEKNNSIYFFINFMDSFNPILQFFGKIELNEDSVYTYFSEEDKKDTSYFNNIKLVLNIILFLNNYNFNEKIVTPEIKDLSKIKSSKKLKKLRSNTQVPYYDIDYETPIHYDKKRYIINGEPQSKYNRHILTWEVRGHWRREKGFHTKDNPKMTWIEPHIKGNKTLPLNNKKIYDVKE